MIRRDNCTVKLVHIIIGIGNEQHLSLKREGLFATWLKKQILF